MNDCFLAQHSHRATFGLPAPSHHISSSSSGSTKCLRSLVRLIAWECFCEITSPVRTCTASASLAYIICIILELPVCLFVRIQVLHTILSLVSRPLVIELSWVNRVDFQWSSFPGQVSWDHIQPHAPLGAVLWAGRLHG